MSTNQQPVKEIKMKDLAGFKWMIINIFGHDYMHDFLINTKRTSKEQTIIDQINKLISIIAKYKKNKKEKITVSFAKFDQYTPKGGGKKQKGGGGWDIIRNKIMHTKPDYLTEFTANTIASWDINITEYTKHNFNRLDELLDIHIEKKKKYY